jgi:YidC/Oxa1 family membrane protein insertase
VDFFTFPPLALILDLAYGALMALSALLEPVAGSTSAALAVVLMTLIVRAFLIPAGVMQARAEQVRARLAPRLRLLQQRHRTDPDRLRRETMQLYRDENASPLAGCLPLMVQAPIIGILYAVFLHPVLAGHTNILLTQTLWGVPLGESLFGASSAGTAPDPVSLVVFGGLLLVIAVVGEITRRSVRPEVGAAPPPAARLLALLPFASVAVAAFVPLAAGLYLAVTVTWTLLQRLLLRRRYPVA